MFRQTPAGSKPARFHARWASGFFRRADGGLLLPSANRCLEVTVTAGGLRTRFMPPFGLLFGAGRPGYERSIPLSRILRVEKAKFCSWWHTARVTFTTEAGLPQCLEFAFTGPLPQIGGGQVGRRDRFVRVLEEALRAAQPP